MSVDPLAGKYPGWSAYNYALCNPLKYIDPNGMDVEWTQDDLFYNLLSGGNGFDDLNNGWRWDGNSDGGDKKNTNSAVSGGILVASAKLTLADIVMNNVRLNHISLQTESNALNFGLDYSPEILRSTKWITGIRISGFILGGISTVFDGFNTFGRNPSMSKQKFWFNVVATTISLTAGIPGAIGASVYYGVDTFVPGGWDTIFKMQYQDYIINKKNGVNMSPWINAGDK